MAWIFAIHCGVERAEHREKAARAAAARRERRGNVDAVEQERTKLVADLAGADIVGDQRGDPFLVEMAAVGAGQ
jgi:hypothetical protein